MKKNKITKIFVATVCLLAFSASAALASNVARTITVYYQDIKLYVDGAKVNTSSEPFIYNGTTYLPVRAVGEALGEQVYWDGNTKSVYIGGNVSAAGNDLMTSCPPYQSFCVYDYYPNETDYFTMAGEKYYSGIHNYNLGGYAYFNLNSQYETLTATIGHVDGGREGDTGTISFELDGRVIATYDITMGDMPKEISLPVSGGNQLVIRMTDTSSYLDMGIGNITIR